jgi:hypothetical protein
VLVSAIAKQQKGFSVVGSRVKDAGEGREYAEGVTARVIAIKKNKDRYVLDLVVTSELQQHLALL